LKNSISIFLGRRLAFGPAAQAARPASAPVTRSPAPASAQLARRGPVHRALPSPPARRASRPWQSLPAAWPLCSGVARRAAAVAWHCAHAPAFICRCPRTRSLAPCTSSPSPPQPRAPSSAVAALELRRRPTQAPPHHSPIPRAPSSASPSSKSCSNLLRLPSTGRTSPRLATGVHGTAMHGRRGAPFSFPLQPRIATLSSSLSPRASPALALWRCRGRRRPLAAGRAAPPRQRAPRHGASPRLAKPARQSGRGPKPCQAAALLLFARAAQAESGHGPVPFRRPAQ